MSLETKKEEEFGMEESMADFENLWSVDLVTAEEGKIYRGTIVRIDSRDVYLDINAKNEGMVPLGEFSNDSLPPALGQEVEVMVVENREDSTIVLSKTKAQAARAWEVAATAYDAGKTVKARVVGKVKGGLNAECHGLKAFVPGSLMSLHQEYDLEKYIGLDYEFKIIEFNRRRRNMVLSRKELLQEERRKNIEHIFETLQEGYICEGIVKNITDYGAFVSIVDGQIDGLLHKADMSWAHVRSVNSLLKLGDRIQVKILGIDREKEKISLGVKQLTSDPWVDIEERFQVGSVHEGFVKNITHFGVFVELADGVEGLVHVSDISWTQRVKHPEEVLKISDPVKCKILSFEKDSRKIALGIKQTEEDPWEKVFDRYTVGDIVKGFVRNITDFGVFVEVESGIQGLIHISDLSWSNKVTHPKQVVTIDQELTVKVIGMDAENKKIALSLKEVTTDPWTGVEQAFPAGSTVEGTVTGLTNFGAFIEIAENVEGMVHISDFSWTEHFENASDLLKVGQKIQCKVMEIDANVRKISLGQKQLTEEPFVQVAKVFPVGSVLQGKISNITNFGAFVEIKDGVDGLLHVSDISWTERVEHPSDKFKVAEMVKVKVLAIDFDARKISLGLKQLSDDPIERFFSKHPAKSIVKALIKEVLSDGSATVSLPEGVEGVIPSKQMVKEITAGQEVDLKVLEFHPRELKVHLSARQAQRDLERTDVEEYNRSVEKKATEAEARPVADQLANLKAELEREEKEKAKKK